MRRWMRAVVAVAAWVAVVGGRPAPAGPDWFPFVIPGDDASATVADMSGLLERPAGAGGFVRVQAGHFIDGRGQRVRLMGTNLCFEAAFPPHQVAEKMAAHLAKLGINCVRSHHLEE